MKIIIHMGGKNTLKNSLFFRLSGPKKVDLQALKTARFPGFLRVKKSLKEEGKISDGRESRAAGNQ